MLATLCVCAVAAYFFSAMSVALVTVGLPFVLIGRLCMAFLVIMFPLMILGLLQVSVIFVPWQVPVILGVW